jgi:hypothetical protein
MTSAAREREVDPVRLTSTAVASTIARPIPAAVASIGYPSWTVLMRTPQKAQATVATKGSRPRLNQVMATAVPAAPARMAT